jgi:tyrosinase
MISIHFIRASLIRDVYQSDLRSIQHDITKSTHQLLTLVHTWPGFSNTSADVGRIGNSLEGIHDEIHGWVGGHMGDTTVAGNFL